MLFTILNLILFQVFQVLGRGGAGIYLQYQASREEKARVAPNHILQCVCVQTSNLLKGRFNGLSLLIHYGRFR